MSTATQPGRQRVAELLEAIPLRARLIAVLSLLLMVALVATTLATVLLMRRDLTSRVDGELRVAAKPVANMALNLRRTPSTLQPQALSQYAVVVMPTNATPTQITNPTGLTARPSIANLALKDPRIVQARTFTVGSLDGDLAWRVLGGVYYDETGAALGTYAVAVPLTTVEHTVHQLLLVTGLIGLGVLLACGGLGWVLVRRAFRPLAQIEDTAAAIAEGDLTRRIPTRSADDEVTSLSRSLNAMLSQIEHSFGVREASEERMRQFVSDASHELRTPLATVRGYAELYRQGAVARPEDVASAMGRIEGEATRMGGLVDDLLTLARIDEEPTDAVAPVDLTVLAADATQDARAQAPDRPITLVTTDGAGPLTVEGSESRLRQVLANLLTNAIRHTPAGTPVEVLLGRSEDSGHVVVQVRDHGQGIDEASARRVFERFYRADKGRSRDKGGSGLGLAIVAAIVAGHEGRAGVAPTSGGGATFVVELPTGTSQEAHTSR